MLSTGRSIWLIFAASCLLIAGGIAPVIAQSRAPKPKNSADVKQPLSELVTPLAPSIVEVCDDTRICTLGTVVSKQGLLVTKASEIKDKKQLVCKLYDGRQFAPVVVSENEQLDLALLKIDANDLAPIDLTRQDVVSAGNFVVCVGQNANPIGFGVVEVDPRTFRYPRQRSQNRRGFLGIQSHTDLKTGALVVDHVDDDSAARRSGIRKGDIIRSIDGEKIDSRESLIRTLGKYEAGSSVELVVVRNQLEMTLKPKLGSYPDQDPLDQWGGGPFNKRRYGFSDVIVHDTVIHPNQCGGPLVDSQGRVVGINIARALRVATYAIPSAKIAAFIQPHELSPTAPAESLDP